MELDSLDQLTPRERECLALVATGLTSKEIAPLLGIEPASVDVTLKRAARRTGISDRRRLARMMREQRPEMTQSLLQQLGQPQKPLVSTTSATPDQPVAAAAQASHQAVAWPVPTPERRWADLSIWQKRAWSIAIAFGALAALALLVPFAHRVLTSAPIAQ